LRENQRFHITFHVLIIWIGSFIKIILGLLTQVVGLPVSQHHFGTEIFQLLDCKDKIVHLLLPVPKEVDQQQTDLLNGCKFSLEGLNWLSNCIFIKHAYWLIACRQCNRRVVVGSVLWRQGGCHAGRMHELPYFVLFVGVTVEEFFNVERTAGGGLDNRTRTVPLGRIEDFLGFDFVFDLVVDVGLFEHRLIQRLLFLSIQLARPILFLGLVALFLFLLHDITNKLLDVDLVVGKSVLLGL
jgi:hypothetical protein